MKKPFRITLPDARPKPQTTAPRPYASPQTRPGASAPQTRPTKRFAKRSQTNRIRILLWVENPARTLMLSSQLLRVGHLIQSLRTDEQHKLHSALRRSQLLVTSSAVWKRIRTLDPALASIPVVVLVDDPNFPHTKHRNVTALSAHHFAQLETYLQNFGAPVATRPGRFRRSLPQLEDLPSISVAERIENFTGQMPEWIAELEEAIEDHNYGAIETLAVEIIRTARELNLPRVYNVAHRLKKAAQQQMSGQLFLLTDDLQGTYMKVFPKIKTLREQYQSRS